MADPTDTPTSPNPEPQSHTIRRGARGRFEPGCSGNPNGRPAGSLNHATLLKRGIRVGDEPVRAAEEIVARAAAGNLSAAKFLVDRLDPRPTGRPVLFAFPDGATIPERMRAAFEAAAAGQITPAECALLTQALEREDKAQERRELRAARLAAERAAAQAKALAPDAKPPKYSRHNPPPPAEPRIWCPPGEEHIPGGIRGLKQMLYSDGPWGMQRAGLTPDSEDGQEIIKWYGPDVFRNAPPGYYDPVVGEGVRKGYKPNFYPDLPPDLPQYDDVRAAIAAGTYSVPVEDPLSPTGGEGRGEGATDPAPEPEAPENDQYHQVGQAAPAHAMPKEGSGGAAAQRPVWQTDEVAPRKLREDYALPFPKDHPGPDAPAPRHRRRPRRRQRGSWMTA